MYKLCFFVPVSHLQSVKTALFAAGAGKIGDYDCCSWETLGCGQFRALEGSQPFIGTQNVVERVEEYKVEMVCEADKIRAAVKVLREAHPYETPAYEVYALLDATRL